MSNKLNRRNFINTVSAAGAGLAIGMPQFSFAAGDDVKPAILGGPKAHPGEFPGWPVFTKLDEDGLAHVLQSKAWGRFDGGAVSIFEKKYKDLLGAPHCIAVSSGTSALYTMLGALDIGPGDEVIIPPYTFVATYNVVVLNYALPVFVDSDRESFQIDAGKIEAAITGQTKVIMPVHMGGSPANLDKILEVSNRRKITLIEDACQAHFAEWRGKKVGNFGRGGAFSFQSSKNLNCAEGGAIITQDEDFAKTCYGFHTQGRGVTSAGFNPGAGTRSTNVRLTEFQGSLLISQLSRVAEQSKLRSENAAYLTKLFNEIPGIIPAKLYEGTTNSAFHLYMFRYDKNQFAGLSREKFVKALSAEGVPCSTGYGKMNKDSYVAGLTKNKHYLKLYGEKTMNDWLARNDCPQNDKLTEEAVWFFQSMLIGPKSDMEQIATSIRKIKKYAADIAKG